MKITYDADADAAYVSLIDVIEAGEASQQVGFIETPNGETQIVLDFDSSGRLLGIEVLHAAQALRAETLEGVKPPTEEKPHAHCQWRHDKTAFGGIDDVLG